MVKIDLVHRAMEATTLASPAARAAVNALFESVASALARGDLVVLRRFGPFQGSTRRTGSARNPRTGEPVGTPRDGWCGSAPHRGSATFPAGARQSHRQRAIVMTEFEKVAYVARQVAANVVLVGATLIILRIAGCFR